MDVPTKKPRISITMDEETLAKLEAWAEEEERPVANLALFILKQALEDRETAPDKGTRQ